MLYSAKRNTSALIVGGILIMSTIIAWAVKHVIEIVEPAPGKHASAFSSIYLFTFMFLAVQTVLYMLERPYKTTRLQDKHLGRLNLVVNVPVCNEDPVALKNCLQSMMEQTRKIDIIHIVVNGPNKVDYRDVKRFAYSMRNRGQRIYWNTNPKPGKREAQVLTAKKFLKEGDIFLTIDSDAYLDSRAVEEGLKPFTNPKIMSVAGIVLTTNNRSALLTRLSDLYFLTGQLVDRSAASAAGSVVVNSGVLAFYRAHIILDNMDAYTHETFFGHPVQFSDDSMLTLYALQRGKTIQQPTCFCFTLMPENISHHIRQQTRWARGSFIRSWWRIKYLPLHNYGFIQQIVRWVEMVMSIVTFAYFFVYAPIFQHAIIPWVFIIMLAVGYMQSLRYMSVSRSDESFWYRLGTVAMEPIPALWSFLVLRFVKYYAIATCTRTGWGTRKEVEVSA